MAALTEVSVLLMEFTTKVNEKQSGALALYDIWTFTYTKGAF